MCRQLWPCRRALAGHLFFATMDKTGACRAAGKAMPEGECLLQIGAVVCDIDGTLLPAGRSAVSARTRLTLLALKSAGVRVVLATGRAPQVALAAAEKIPYDALVCAQGAAVLEKGGKPRALHALDEQQMYALVDFCENGEWPLNFVFDEGYFAYVEYERMLRGLPENDMQRPWLFDGEDQNRHLAAMPYGACAFLPESAVQAFGQKYGHLGLCFVPFAPGKWDIYPAGVDTAVPCTVEEKTALVCAHGLALWDTVQQCTITGAQDASIRNVTPTDIPWLCAAAPIRRVLCNGAAAYSLCVKYHALPGVQVVKLPSTSPANAAWTLEKLRAAWGPYF